MAFNRNNFKISFVNEMTRFFVNEEKRTVVCVLYGNLNVPTIWDGCVYIPQNLLCERGVAKCAPEDVFDVERGKRIALAKAENQMYLSALKYLDNYMAQIAVFVNAFEMFNDKAYHACAHNDDYISSLSYEAHPNYRENLTPLKKG